MKYNVIVIGGGVVGTAVLDRLCRYDVRALLLEKEDDVASFSTRANSGIVHAGYDCEPNTLKAKFNVEGNPLVYRDAEDLGVPYLKCGSLVVAAADQLEQLDTLRQKAVANGVEVKILDRAETLQIEPNVSDNIAYSLYAPTAGIVSPYQLAIGYADRSVLNGGKIVAEAEVTGIQKVSGGFRLETTKGTFEGEVVINCAGPAGAKMNDFVGAEHYETLYRKGEYFVIDNTERKNINTVIFPLPSKLGKGILVAPTADGNIIYGPTATDTVESDTSTSLEGLDTLRKSVPLTYAHAAFNKCIRTYAGVRTIIGHDFIIGESKLVPDFYAAIGICSPGLTSSPAIAEYLASSVASAKGYSKKDNITTELPKRKRLVEMSGEELNEAVKKDPAEGRIVCRCEKVTEAQIVRAIHSPFPATTVDAVKRRVRAGMGRCQGGFCGPRVMEILARELDIPLEKVKKGGGAEIAPYKLKGWQ